MKVDMTWGGGMKFEAVGPSGMPFVMDALGEGSQGPSPVEALVASAAACSGIDVVSILEKKRQKIDSYRMEIEWDRGPEGIYPRPVTAIRIRHFLTGELDPAAVERAVELSDEKYCTVVATLRVGTEVTTTWEIA